MIHYHKFTFNPFQENTYLLYDESKSAVIVDPGCYTSSEEKEVRNFITENDLNLGLLLNTHCHIDHVLGNAFINEAYGLKPMIHSADSPILKSISDYGKTFGINVSASPEPVGLLDDLEEISFGNSTLQIKHIPGHSPGHVVFIDQDQKKIFGGDVLFHGSIGRTDLPLGDHDTLISSIKEKLFLMGDDFEVFPGHGPSTTIGYEKKNNPFLQ